MASYNRVIIMGNLTRDPELKQINSGQSVCRFGVASNRQFKNKQTGMMIQEVCFIDIDVWGAQAESCGQYLQKGRLVLVEGRLKFDSWEDNEGNKRSKHSVVADRVTFLANAGAQADVEDVEAGSSGESERPAPKSASSSEGASYTAPRSAAPKRAAKPAAPTGDTQIPNTGEISFEGEKPFEDDLPF